LWRYRDFCEFPDGGCRHVEFSKIRNFNDLSAVEGQYASSHQISPQSAAKIWRFNGSQNGGRPPSCVCEIRIFLMVCAVKGHILHQRTKFY